MTPDGRDEPRYDAPLDETDPRYGRRGPARPHERELVTSRGPGPDPESAAARFARIIIPTIAVLGALAVAFVFWTGLDPGSGRQVVGPVEQVRSAVAERPRRVCYGGELPCAWLTVHDGELLALNTSGPLPEEFGRAGVGWCPGSELFGANSTGSRFDPAGRVLRGPARRGLDRFAVDVTDGEVVIDFFALETGLPAGRADDLIGPAGPLCEDIPFDRDADLDLPAAPG